MSPPRKMRSRRAGLLWNEKPYDLAPPQRSVDQNSYRPDIGFVSKYENKERESKEPT
jgi:hypothetical protein